MTRRCEKEVLVSHPTGNEFCRALLDGLESSSLLQEFHTTLWRSSRDGGAVWPLGWCGPLLRRRTYDLPSNLMKGFVARETVRLMAAKAGLAWLTRHERGWASIDQVCRVLDRRVARSLQRKKARAVYAYEDSACQTFRVAAELGIPRFYELPIAHWRAMRRILSEEAERLPEWEPTLVATRDSDAKLARKDEELRLATGIVVPSKFVADTLPEFVRETPTLVAPFGSPVVPPALRRRGPGGKNFRVLFAGSMSQRKGLADVLAAMRLLNRSDVELVVMGSPMMPMAFYRNQFAGFMHEPGRPHDEVLKLMATCDALVLPSLVEGRALVQQEALACGLPIVVTRNAGGEDLVDEGRTGFLVPVRSPEIIAAKLAWLADHRDAVENMREFCVRQAAERSWAAYAASIVELIGRQSSAGGRTAEVSSL